MAHDPNNFGVESVENNPLMSSKLMISLPLLFPGGVVISGLMKVGSGWVFPARVKEDTAVIGDGAELSRLRK